VPPGSASIKKDKLGNIPKFSVPMIFGIRGALEKRLLVLRCAESNLSSSIPTRSAAAELELLINGLLDDPEAIERLGLSDMRNQTNSSQLKQAHQDLNHLESEFLSLDDMNDTEIAETFHEFKLPDVSLDLSDIGSWISPIDLDLFDTELHTVDRNYVLDLFNDPPLSEPSLGVAINTPSTVNDSSKLDSVDCKRYSTDLLKLLAVADRIGHAESWDDLFWSSTLFAAPEKVYTILGMLELHELLIFVKYISTALATLHERFTLVGLVDRRSLLKTYDIGTMLKYSVIHRDATMVMKLISCASIDAKSKNSDSHKPLMVSPEILQSDLVEFCCFQSFDDIRNSPASTMHPRHKILKALLDVGVNVDYVSKRGTPLSLASEAGDDTVVRLLLEKGADVTLAMVALQSIPENRGRQVAMKRLSRINAKYRKDLAQENNYRLRMLHREFRKEYASVTAVANRKVNKQELMYHMGTFYESSWADEMNGPYQDAFTIGIQVIRELVDGILPTSISATLSFLTLARAMSKTCDAINGGSSEIELSDDIEQWQMLFTGLERLDFRYAVSAIWNVPFSYTQFEEPPNPDQRSMHCFQEMARHLLTHINGLFPRTHGLHIIIIDSI
jgi:hypothetical protein